MSGEGTREGRRPAGGGPQVRETYPTGADYSEALRDTTLCFAHPAVARGQVAMGGALRMPRVVSGNFGSVFRVTSAEPGAGREIAVKCFTRAVPGRLRRYRAIGEALRAAAGDWRVPVEYVPRGVLVHGTWYPVILMEWVEGTGLIPWLEEHLDDPAAIGALADRFADLVRDLEAAGFAHGDLQHGNIVVRPDGSLRLIDYDGMYVPALAGLPAAEHGHRNYQHPARGPRDFGPGLDRFSAHVIHLSLRALARAPELWRTYHEEGGEHLLLKGDDYADPTASDRFASVACAVPELTADFARLAHWCREPVAAVAPLVPPTLPPVPCRAEEGNLRLPGWLAEGLAAQQAARTAHEAPPQPGHTPGPPPAPGTARPGPGSGGTAGGDTQGRTQPPAAPGEQVRPARNSAARGAGRGQGNSPGTTAPQPGHAPGPPPAPGTAGHGASAGGTAGGGTPGRAQGGGRGSPAAQSGRAPGTARSGVRPGGGRATAPSAGASRVSPPAAGSSAAPGTGPGSSLGASVPQSGVGANSYSSTSPSPSPVAAFAPLGRADVAAVRWTLAVWATGIAAAVGGVAVALVGWWILGLPVALGAAASLALTYVRGTRRLRVRYRTTPEMLKARTAEWEAEVARVAAADASARLQEADAEVLVRKGALGEIGVRQAAAATALAERHRFEQERVQQRLDEALRSVEQRRTALEGSGAREELEALRRLQERMLDDGLARHGLPVSLLGARLVAELERGGIRTAADFTRVTSAVPTSPELRDQAVVSGPGRSVKADGIAPSVARRLQSWRDGLADDLRVRLPGALPYDAAQELHRRRADRRLDLNRQAARARTSALAELEAMEDERAAEEQRSAHAAAADRARAEAALRDAEAAAADHRAEHAAAVARGEAARAEALRYRSLTYRRYLAAALRGR
ncbi:hypothetical protein [Yinghuangia soli]|uniref:Protein kinase domain-containing protein n=1 Tax=Yinghuangia soli TaxID=2908204 RepID=A0AA41PV72_9ACTN|nr:hypothetical protein [Yinghuangia soli]MCF2526316.1 hypothetical protein [Yinghuangia soli]